MRITHLELVNIKSYRQAYLEFTEGLNAVCGPNGSGKTTILEAIGWALFDYLPYKQDQFRREGEKSGTVRVGLLDRNGRAYEVVRKIGTPSGHYVWDVELDCKLVERSPEVLKWVRDNALGLEGEVDLEALFENAVGVPQGTMTAVFLQTGKSRKGIFDPLLRVDEYEVAWETLRETVSFLEKRIAGLAAEISRLTEIVEVLPQRESDLQNLARTLDVTTAEMARLTAQQAEVQARLEELNALERWLAEVAAQRQTAGREVGHLEEALGRSRTLLDAALQARDVVEASREGFQRVQEARVRRAALEQRRAERDRLNELKTTAVAEMRGTEEQIAAKNRELETARAAGVEAATLDGAVARQDELDALIMTARTRLEGRAPLERQLEVQRAEQLELDRSIAGRAEQIARATAAVEPARALPEAERALEAANAEIKALAEVEERKVQIEREGKKLKERADRLEAQERELATIKAELLQITGPDPATVQVRADALREERARLVATREFSQVALRELEEGRCPLLGQTCPVVAHDPSVLGRSPLAKSGGQVETLDREIAAVVVEVEAAQKAEKRRQELQILEAGLTRTEERAGVETDLRELRAEYRRLDDRLAARVHLCAEAGRLQGEVKRLRDAAREADTLPMLQNLQARDDEARTRRQGQIAALEADCAALDAVERDRMRWQEELEALGNPRGRQAELRIAASRVPELEQTLTLLQASLQDRADRLRAVAAQLQGFPDLDAELAEVQAVEQQHLDAYTRYLQHQSEAEQVDVRTREMQSVAGNLEAIRTQVAELERAERVLREQYDAERHEAVRKQQLDLTAQLSKTEEQLSRLIDDRESIESEVQTLRAQQVRLNARREEHAELEAAQRVVVFLRRTIRDAGPAVTETLLQRISAAAGDIFSEILDDHASELRWQEGYEIVVQRGAEERQFAQLSGGEQMSAALAVRLALLKEMSEVDVAFFDEPTQNMDVDRRVNLAGQIEGIRGFDQMVVISHDDTFEHHTDHLIRLRKQHGETVVET